MKKVTMQDIADSLGISRTTVWKVFSGQDTVSAELRKKVIDKAREFNYSVPDTAFPEGTETLPPPSGIALAVCRPETSLFWMSIIHQAAKELSFQNINLIYTYLPSKIEEGYQLPANLTNGQASGMIVMNVYDERLLGLLAASPLPKVFLDTATHVPFSALHGDLVTMENSSSVSALTERLIRQGCRRFGFIGDINYALSNYERFMGFASALKRHGLTLEPEWSMTGSIGADTYREEIDAFLNTLPDMPDAFVCVSDYVACLLMQLLEKRGLRVPQDIAICGFDDITENPLAENLTSVRVFNRDIGTRLAAQIRYRIEHPAARFEQIYISSQPVFRSSTEIGKL
ncbi:MAG: LacI family DNA-binding transcriptional regulator [Eubacteriales bacterium]|nr:LacI family DNA-binding transcriptional regulator [Eubacteriales bacterium]